MPATNEAHHGPTPSLSQEHPRCTAPTAAPPWHAPWCSLLAGLKTGDTVRFAATSLNGSVTVTASVLLR